jgi:hypothetical protein
MGENMPTKESPQSDGNGDAEFVDFVAERSVIGGFIVIGLGRAPTAYRSGFTGGRFVMGLKTAVELRNALNDLIDDQSAGMTD